jgi:hypothetical protein
LFDLHTQYESRAMMDEFYVDHIASTFFRSTMSSLWAAVVPDEYQWLKV